MVVSYFWEMVKPCWRASMDGEGEETAGRSEGVLWYKDYGRHAYGDFSMAVVQANGLLEDQSQLESGSFGTFVGVYDGHGGAEVSQFVADNLFANLMRLAAQQYGITEKAIRKAYSKTDEDFLSIVKAQWQSMPQIASSGSCCLAGIMTKGLLYIANAGDSRAVLGRIHKKTREVHAIQLSIEHNANNEYAREEIRSLHPDDPNILALKHKVWRVKGIIQVTKSIGDAYLKRSEFNREPIAPKFRLEERFDKPIINSDPSILLHRIQPDDQFIIFASDGLWEHISNQEAVNIVQSSPRNGVARKLVVTAMQEAARKREMRYTDLEKIEVGVRRHFHDDISVVVVFLDLRVVERRSHRVNVSERGAEGVISLAQLPPYRV